MAELRIIQYGIGPIGATFVQLLAAKANVRLVGAIDADPAKVGQDLGRVAGLERDLGVLVSADAEAVLAAGADVVLHATGSYLESVASQLEACLAAGCHVVSSCEELSYPWRKHPALSRRLDETARRHGVVLHGTGVNPGFVMDKLPITLSSVAQQVSHVAVTRVVDAGTRRLPLQKKVGAGLSEAEFHAEVEAGRLKHHGLPESAAMIADALGLAVGEIHETIEPVLASEEQTTRYLTVRAGQVAGVRQVCVGRTGDRELLRLELAMYVGAQEPADTITLEGKPALRLVIPGGTPGDLATAAAVVNAIPRVRQAAPGLRTAIDLPVHYVTAL